MRRATPIAAVLATVLLVTGCDPADPGATASPSTTTSPAIDPGEGTLRWALGADPTSLDPRRIVRGDDAIVVDALFDSLTRLDARLNAVPALALRWDAADDARSFTFHLDPEARWHDGTPVVAGDVVRGLRRVADATLEPPSLHAGLLADVTGFGTAQLGGALAGVVAVDDATVRIELRRPVPELPALLAHPALAPVPQVAVDDPVAFGDGPIGNGPFQLVDAWTHNQFIRLVPSAGHPDPGAVGEVVFRIYADDGDGNVRMADLLAQQVQVAPLPAGQRATVRAELGAAGAAGGQGVRDGVSDTVSMLVFDTRQAPFDDERFRRAVSMLVDRPALADRTDGARIAATSLVPPSLPGAQPGACRWCVHDPTSAGELIRSVLADRPQDAGPLPRIVLQTSGDALHETLANALSVALRGFGFEVRIVRPGVAEYLDAVREEGSAIVRLSWSSRDPTLRGWTEGLVGTSGPGAAISGWGPPALAELLGEADASANAVERGIVWQQVERLVLDQAVIAPLFHYRHDLVVGPGVSGLVVDPMGNVDLAAVRLVRVAP